MSEVSFALTNTSVLSVSAGDPIFAGGGAANFYEKRVFYSGTTFGIADLSSIPANAGIIYVTCAGVQGTDTGLNIGGQPLLYINSVPEGYGGWTDIVSYPYVTRRPYVSSYTGAGGAPFSIENDPVFGHTDWTRADLAALGYAAGLVFTSGNSVGSYVTKAHAQNITAVGVDYLSITNVSPAGASPGTTVTITGHGFNGSFGHPSRVKFGGVAATGVAVVSDTSLTCTVPVIVGTVDVVVELDVPSYRAYTAHTVSSTLSGYSVVNNVFQLALPTGTVYQFATSAPSSYALPVSVYVNGVFYPAGTVYHWTLSNATPTDTGWWVSVNEDFVGASIVLNNSRPKDPRSFKEIVAFATSSTAMQGGFPGPCCMWNNHMVYATGGYTVGTDSPAIRIFDGRFDREVIRLPNTAAGVVPKAVMTMLAANGTIYLTTLDTGSSSADWIGRAFELDINSGTLTPLGTTFTAGHVPYALAWHQGRLWCGTNRQSSAASGKIFYFRPDIDTSWTDDYTLSSSTTAGCTSLLSYKGLLYVGTSNAAAAFAKVLVRSNLGVYTTSKTAAGGTARANNAILAMAEFNGNLYASFWNADTTAVSLIYKFDNSSWTTAYTGATTTLIPYVALPIDSTSALLAIGGGVGYNAGLLYTTDGASWTDETVFLSQGSPASTGLPCFGIVVL